MKPTFSTIKLGELCRINYGKGLPRHQRSGAAYPVMGSNGQIGSHSQALTKAPCIIIGRKGSIGEVTLSNIPCWPIDTAYYIDETDARVDIEFLSFRLRSAGLTKKNKAGAIPSLLRPDLQDIDILLPSLPEQQRIVARIKECMERIGEIEDLRAEAVKEREILPRSFCANTYQRLLDRFPSIGLADAGIICGGGTPSKQNPAFWCGDIPWISPKDMKQHRLSGASLYISKSAIKESSAKLIPANSVLFVVRGMILIHTLPVAVNVVSAAINQDMKAITPRSGINAEFLATMIRGAERRLLSKVDVAGHGTRKLQTKHWSSLPIPLPKLSEQEEIVEEVLSFEMGTSQLKDLYADKDLSQFRDAILLKAFAGEL